MNTRIFGCLFMAASLLLACSQKKEGSVQLLEKSFGEEVSVQGNMIFTFDQELVSDTLLNYWDTIPYIQFEPEIKGRFSWISSQELEFAPFQSLRPATDYRASLTDALLQYKSDLKLDGEKQFEFHTPYLRLAHLHGYWAENAKGKESHAIHLAIELNYPVEGKALLDKIEIEVDGKKQKVALLKEENSEKQMLILPEFKMSEKSVEVSAYIAPGLKALGSNQSQTAEMKESTFISSPFVLSITDVQSNHDGVVGEFIVKTSQEVKSKDIKRFIRILPEVKYTVKTGPNSIRISSEEFNVNQKYELQIKENLLGVLGGKLKNTYSSHISFGKLRPTIQFRDQQSVYLTSAGGKNIEVEIVNIPKVKASLTKIYENNILHFLGGGSYYRRHYDRYAYSYSHYDDYYYEQYNYYNPGYEYYRSDQYGDIIWKQELNTTELKMNGHQRILNLDFEDKLKDHPGLYLLKVEGRNRYYQSAYKVICISDIGLIVKSGLEEISIFANSIKTAEAISGVDLKVIGRNNQISAELKTDALGVATFQFAEGMSEGFEPVMVTASYQGDYTYLPFSRTRVGTSRYEVGGKRENKAGLDAYLFAERDIYRPGETIHLACVIRDKDWETPEPMPVKFKLLSPNGREFSQLRKSLNKEGGFTVDVSLPPTATTGGYIAQIFSANDVLLSSKRISVEEFVPDRIKVDLELDKKIYDLKDPIMASLEASNFFGPPAANRNYEMELTLSRKGFHSESHKDYLFYIPNLNHSFGKVRRNGKTDAEGKASQKFDLSASYANTGLMSADVFSTVFDETGRPVNRRVKADIYTQDVFYGLKRNSYYNRTGQRVQIPLIAVDKKGKALNGVKARVLLIKHEFKTVLAKSGSYFRYNSQPIEKVLIDKEVVLNGKDYIFEYVPELTGRYELRVSKPGVNTYIRAGFYCYGYGRTHYNSFQVNREGRIDIELDKENYKVGESARVLLKTPFSGKLLITVESDKVLKHFYQQTDKRSASVKIDLNDLHVPNAYITATLIRPHGQSDLPLTVAHGFAPIMVENPDNRLAMEIKASSDSRSRTRQRIEVKTKPGAMVTIAAVDEGILQLTGFKTPAPYDFFYGKRALEVESFDLYPYLFPEIDMQGGRPGGDGMNLEKRINPLVNKRTKLASFWSGMIEADGSGIARFEVDIPQFSGALRIMATGVKGDAFGATEKNMRVADPIVISAGIPRFFSPGDIIEVPVTVSNTTEKSASCKMRMELEGPIKAGESASQSLNISANSEGNGIFEILADRNIGQARINILVDAMGETFQYETDITVRPASTLQKRSGAGFINGGESKSVTLDLEGFMPSSVNSKLVISKSPLIEFTDDLEYLLRSRFWGLSQTVSAAFPQLYYPEIAKAVYRKNGDNPNPHYHVREAIKRLQLMQLHNGGMTSWPHYGKEDWWGTIYATHFLYEADKAGFEVPSSMLDLLYKYLIERLKDVKLEEYYEDQYTKRTIAPREVGYSLFVLSLAGKAQKARMNYWKSRLNTIGSSGAYMLAASYALAGDKTRYKEVVPNAFTGNENLKGFGSSFASYVRDEAMALYVLLECDPDNAQIGLMAKHVSTYLKNRPWLNVYDRAFCYLAIGKLAADISKTTATATVLYQGKTVGNFADEDLSLITDQPVATGYEIQTKGEGRLYYFWETEGISVDGSYIEEDSYMMARKTFYNRDGKVISNNTVQQNDLIVVRLMIEGKTDAYIRNVVLTDLLPAGFEIENPRTTELPGFSWIRNRCNPNYMDVRDDRINMFIDVSSSPCNYYYLVRAVSRGTFQMGPVSADAIYDGEYHSYHGAGQMKVVAKE